MQSLAIKRPAPWRIRHLCLLTAALAMLFATVPLANLLTHSPAYGFEENRIAPAFELNNARGERRSLADYRGRHVYLVFGYLRCADLCHSQVMNLLALAEQLAHTDTAFLYLAMDTRHDDPALVEAYFDQRHDSFTSLHAADMATMQSIANAYNAPYRVAGNPSGDSYDIEHPARIFLIDPRGRIQYSYRGVDPAVHLIAADYHRLNPASKRES